jgi:hypothetical protein
MKGLSIHEYVGGKTGMFGLNTQKNIYSKNALILEWKVSRLTLKVSYKMVWH